MKRNDAKLVKVLKALGHKNRLQIFRFIAASKRMCAGGITNKLNISQPAVSQHLRILKNSGLIRAEKIGLFVHYSVSMRAIGDFKEKLFELLDIKEVKECKTCPKDVKNNKPKKQ